MWTPWLLSGSTWLRALHGGHRERTGKGLCVAADVKLINRDCKFVAMTPDIVKGKGMRMISDKKAGMVSDELVYSGSAEEMFLEAISRNAAYYLLMNIPEINSDFKSYTMTLNCI